MKWKTSDFDYNLPEELIAQTPLLDRTSSRMLVIHNTEKKYEDKHFYDIVDYLHAGDVLVRNTHVLSLLDYLVQRKKQVLMLSYFY